MDSGQLRTILIIWLCVGQIAMFSAGYLVFRKLHLNWRAILPDFLKRHSLNSIELKIFSFDEAFEAKVVIDEKGTIQTINRKADQLLGYRKQELRGKSYELLIPAKERHKLKEQLKRDIGQPINEEYTYLSVLNKGGFEISAEVSTIKKELDGKFYCVVIIRNRGRELNIIKQLKQSIEIYKMKLDICAMGEELNNTGSWIWDLTDDELTMSDGYKRIVGMGRNEPSRVKSTELRVRVYGPDEQLVKDALDSAFAGKGYNITYRQKRPSDFKIITIRSIVRPVLSESGVPIILKGATTLLDEKDA